MRKPAAVEVRQSIWLTSYDAWRTLRRARLREPSAGGNGWNAVRDAPALMLRPERVVLHALVRGLAPRRVLEIGSHMGGSTMIICAALDEIGAGVVACIDPRPVIERNDWDRVAHRATMILGTSPEAIGRAVEVVGGKLDFVLLDGDHGYDGVSRDIYGVLPHLERGAYVLFHDSHYWQIEHAIDEAVADHSSLVDCGVLSRETAVEDRLESGHAVVWGGLRLLRFTGA